MGLRWPFVGRTAELARAVAALSGAPVGGGFIVIGGPGVGKSGLLRQAATRLDEARFSVVEVFTSPAASSLPLGAFIHLLPSDALGVTDAQYLHRRTFQQVQAQAAGRHVVLVVDDVHLLDPLGAALVYSVVHSGLASLAATQRSDERVHPSVEALWLEDRLDRFPLEPLREPEVGEVLSAVVGGAVEQPTVHRLWRLAGRNLLLLRELVDALVTRGAFTYAGGVWSWSGHDAGLSTVTTEMMGRRVAAQPREVRAVLELAALADPVGRAAVASFVGEDAVRRALDADLVHSYRDARRTVLRVAHPLLAAVALRRMDPDDRDRHLARLTEHLRAHGARRREDVISQALWHVDHGVPVPAETLIAAGRLLYAAHDLRLAQRVAQAAVAAGGGFDAVDLLASVQGFAGVPHAAIDLLDAHNARAGCLADQVRWHLTRELIQFNMMHDPSAVERLQEAATALPAPDRDILLSLAACLLAARGEVAAGWAALNDQLVDPAVDEPARLHSAAMAAAIAAMRGEPDARQRLNATQAAATAPGGGWPTLRVTFEYAQWVVTFVTGRMPRPAPAASDAMRFFPMLDAQSTLGGAIALRMRGQIRAAAQAAAAARSSAEVGGQVVLTGAIAEQAVAAALAGDVAAAAGALAEADRVQRHTMALQQPMLELARIELRLLQDGADAAAGAARDLATRLRDEGLHGFETHALHQLSRLGRVTAADAARLAELAARIDEPFPLAAALHAGGLVADEPDALARAGQLYVANGLQLFAVEALAQRFASLLRAGHVGVGTVADELAGLLATVDVRTVPALRIAPPDLTPNEQKVADLVERGLDNAEICTALFFTRRTTQTYLSRIYDKLRVHKRVDVPGVVRLHRALRGSDGVPDRRADRPSTPGAGA